MQADLNGDGHLEVIVATHDYKLQVCVLLSGYLQREPVHRKGHLCRECMHRVVSAMGLQAMNQLLQLQCTTAYTASATNQHPNPCRTPAGKKTTMPLGLACVCTMSRVLARHLLLGNGKRHLCPAAHCYCRSACFMVAVLLQLVRPEPPGRAGEGFAPVEVVTSFSLLPQKVMLGRDRRPVSSGKHNIVLVSWVK